MTDRLKFDKEDREFLFSAFMDECMTGVAEGHYEDNGGHIIHETHLDGYFGEWLDSQTIAELRATISEWGTASVPKKVTE